MPNYDSRLLKHFDLRLCEENEIAAQHEVDYAVAGNSLQCGNDDEESTAPIAVVTSQLAAEFGMQNWQLDVDVMHGGIEVITLLTSEYLSQNFTYVGRLMRQLGYFCSVEMVEGYGQTKWRMSQWEPLFQPNENNLVRSMEKLYHLTPLYNLESILSNGLIPAHRNELLRFPRRVYMFKEDVRQQSIDTIGKQLNDNNNDPRNTGEYVLLAIDVNKVKPEVDFFSDPLCDSGVFTTGVIPPDSVTLDRRLNFQHSTKPQKYTSIE